MAELGSEITSTPTEKPTSTEKTVSLLDSTPVTITNQKLNGNNFLPWSRAVELFITGRRKKEYLSDKMQVPAETDEKFPTWEAENSMIMSWLLGSMTPEENQDGHQLPNLNMEQSNPTHENETQPTKRIFILSGQSNMAGRGGVNHHRHWDRFVPPQCAPDPTKIHRLNSHLQWESAHEPLHFDIDTKKTCGVGPGMSFANAVKDLADGVIGLVPCAVGGTAIKEWARGTHLYENMIRRSKSSSISGEIKALLWYQGESDTSSEHDASCYKEKMEELIANVRADLNLPDLPVIQVAIASGDEKFMEKVRKAQLEMDVQNVVCVDAKGLQLKEDHLHLTTESQVQLGQMLAQAYIKHFVC